MADERGERGGVVLDKGGSDDTGGDENVALTPIEKDNEIIDESGRASDIDRGTEDTQVGADDRGQEGEVLEEGEESGVPDDTRISSIEQTLKEVSEKLNAKPAEATKPLSDDDWSKLEQDWGVPRPAIERITAQNVKIVNHLKEMIDSRFAKLEFNETLSEFSKQPGFADASRYKKEVNEFLASYEPKHWSNPELIKRAVFYARGVNANANVARAQNNMERNRKIAVSARPSAPAGVNRRVASAPLTPSQREAAAMMPGGEAEYRRFQTKNMRTIE